MKLEDLEAELKTLIVEALMLKDTTPAEIEATAPLFFQGLGLDSIDALELSIAIEARWGFKIGTDDVEARKAFATVRSLASFILENLPASAVPEPLTTVRQS